MAERVTDIVFVNQVHNPHRTVERTVEQKVPRLQYAPGREFTVTSDGPYVRIVGTSGKVVKVPHANIAYMLVEDVPDEPKKGGGK